MNIEDAFLGACVTCLAWIIGLYLYVHWPVERHPDARRYAREKLKGANTQRSRT